MTIATYILTLMGFVLFALFFKFINWFDKI